MVSWELGGHIHTHKKGSQLTFFSFTLDQLMKQWSEDTGHQALKDSDPWDTGNKMRPAPQLPQFTAWREFPGHGAGRENQGRVCQTPWIKELLLEEELKVATVHMAECWIKELHRERTLKFEYSHGHWTVSVCKEATRDWDRTTEKIRRNNLWRSHRPGIVLFPPAKVRNLLIHRTWGIVTKRLWS